MDLLFTIIASALASFYFIEFARFHKKLKLDFRPFNCLVCLPAWIGLVLYFLPTLVSEIIIVMFSASILAVILKTLMNKTI